MSSHLHHKTAAADRVLHKAKLGYGTGMLAYALMMNGYSQMVNPIFNISLGISPVVIGWIFAIGSFWEALVSPILGSVSDNTRSQLGRRRPWIALGSVLSALSFAAIWWVPEEKSDLYYSAHLAVTTLVFYLSFAIFSVSYMALGMELSPDYHERTAVVAYRTFLAKIGLMLAGTMFWWTQRDFFSGTIDGMRWTGLGAAAVILLTGFIPSVTSRAHPYAALKPGAKRVPFLRSAAATVRITSFRRLCLASFVLLLSFTMVQHLGFYMNLYVVYGGDQKASANLTALAPIAHAIPAMASIPVISWISMRLGKRNTLLGCLAIACIGTLSKWVCYRPDMPYLQLVPNLLEGIGMGAAWLLISAMIPEAVDEDELVSGERREGMFSAVYSSSFKLGVGVALIFSGYTLAWSGYDADLGRHQSESVELNLRLFFTTIPAVGILIGFWLMLRYSISEERAYEIRQELEARHHTNEQENLVEDPASISRERAK
ncbi:MAG: MFS transporter [Luteolibacter sp.]